MEQKQNLGHKIPRKGGYHAIPPLDVMFNIRSEMVKIIQESGIEVRYHRHEVGGPGQSEIEILFAPLVRAADNAMWIKYAIKMVAQRRNRTVTFMPKPLYGEAGSGVHIHLDIEKMNQEIRAKIKPLPASLEEALDALREDHQNLLEGKVFNEA